MKKLMNDYWIIVETWDRTFKEMVMLDLINPMWCGA